jgi:alkanesulfonate monooxygenase SsuD/methylene tetrahydromethanopterin reductase-like flavin-dependent oxidoreductase (luciferase family)
MDLGIGLPNAVPNTSGSELTDFARAADEAGFSTLGTIDRIAYGNYEPVTALAAAAAVTSRIKLATSVMLGPLRMNPAMVAKQILSLDALAGGGRAVLGIGLGGREDDYALSPISMSERGSWMDDALAEIRRIWDGEGEDQAKVGPARSNGGPSLIVGGGADQAFTRAAKYGAGWIMGGGPPDQFEAAMPKLDTAWKAEGRSDEPRRMGLGYFSLGDDANANAGQGGPGRVRERWVRRVHFLPVLERRRAGRATRRGGRTLSWGPLSAP